MHTGEMDYLEEKKDETTIPPPVAERLAGWDEPVEVGVHPVPGEFGWPSANARKVRDFV